jgi:hypothetical protein
LEPGGIYWARRNGAKDQALTVVQVSTMFGEDREYWTLATLGSDQHHMPSDFEIIERVPAPAGRRSLRQAAE